MAVEPDAELTIGGLVAIGGLAFGQLATEVGDGVLEVAEGARVTVGAAARAHDDVFGELVPDSLAAGNDDARIVVRVAEGGSFDMSAAPASVQVLFRVEGSSGADAIIPPGSYRLLASAVALGAEVRLAAAPQAVPLASLAVVDALGRVVANCAGGPGSVAFAAPEVPGLYTVALSDRRGRVGALRLLVVE